MSILNSASGLAYLAFCPKEQRDNLLDVLAQSKKTEDQPAKNRNKVYESLVETRKNGFSVWKRSRRVADETSFSVPVMAEERLLAVLTLRFASTAISEADAIDKFVPKLRAVAKNIASDFMRQQHNEPLCHMPPGT